MRELLTTYREAFKYFMKKKGGTLAAASSFYIILAFIPSILLIIRLLTKFLSNYQYTQEELLSFSTELFPQLDTSVILKAQAVIQQIIYAPTQSSLFTYFILAYSGLAFINSVWSSLFLITEDPHHDSIRSYVKGPLILAFTFLFLLFILFLPSLLFDLMQFIQQNSFFLYIRSHFPSLKPLINFFLQLDPKSLFFRHSISMISPLLILYFALLYRWFYSSKISLKDALIASITFVASLMLSKLLFLLYFTQFGGSIARRYGDFTTYLIPLLWTYIVMCLFYFGFCLCHALADKKKAKTNHVHKPTFL